MLRKGHTSRIHDYGPFTAKGRTLNFVFSFCGEYFSNGSHKWPMVIIYIRYRRPRKDMTNWSASCTHVETTKKISVPLPYVKWAYPQNPVMRFIHKSFDRFYRWAFVTTYQKGWKNV